MEENKERLTAIKEIWYYWRCYRSAKKYKTQEEDWYKYLFHGYLNDYLDRFKFWKRLSKKSDEIPF